MQSLKAEGHGGLQEPGLGAAIIALATEAEAVDPGLAAHFFGDGVSQLDFPASTTRRTLRFNRARARSIGSTL